MEVLDVTCTVWVEVTGRSGGGDGGMQELSVDSSLGIKMNYGGIYWEEEAGADL